MINSRQKPEEYIEGIGGGDRLLLSKAITILESKLLSDTLLAQEILEGVLPLAGRSVRIGITGVPGVGKSTFIEAIGEKITGSGHKLAVLSIDPSSALGRGSILGDKTRMEKLSHNPNAYIRPSPAGTTLGGVTAKTREAMLLCEAAGFDVIIIETVGVGQSETVVRGMVDFFLLLMLAGAGDELQGIKKGIMEMADGLVITKSDGNNLSMAKKAQREYANAMHLFPAQASGWIPPVLLSSALENTGIGEVWDMILKYRDAQMANGYIEDLRKDQNITWFKDSIRQRLLEDFFANEANQQAMAEMLQSVTASKIPVTKAVDLLFQKTEQK